MNYITLEEAKRIVLDEIGSSSHCELMLVDSATIDFQWGALFAWDSKEYVETGKNPVVGNSPILVDKVNGSIHSINYLGVIDKQLEEYREKMGYPHVIKFPVKGDFVKMTDLEKVFALMATRELRQIEEAILIVKEKNLFDLEGFGTVCHNYKVGNFVEAISKMFNSIRGVYHLYEYPLKTIPKEIALFHDRITSIYIYYSEVVELPDSILKLDRLESIAIEGTPLRKMPLDLRGLKALKKVRLEYTEIAESELRKFKLPVGCEIQIIA